MAIRAEAQMTFDDELIDDEVLEELLIEWQRRKAALQPYREAYDTQHKRLQGEIEARALSVGSYRCGGFIITIREHDSREVAFTRKSNRSVRITRAKDSGDGAA